MRDKELKGNSFGAKALVVLVGIKMPLNGKLMNLINQRMFLMDLKFLYIY